MATVPESANQGKPSNRNLGPFPPFWNIGAPYMETLSLPRFTIGFPVWLFSTSLVPNVQTTSQPISPPPKQYQPQDDPKIDPLPSSPLWSSSSSSCSYGESCKVSNHTDKIKKKGKIKKNKNK